MIWEKLGKQKTQDAFFLISFSTEISYFLVIFSPQESGPQMQLVCKGNFKQNVFCYFW